MSDESDPFNLQPERFYLCLDQSEGRGGRQRIRRRGTRYRDPQSRCDHWPRDLNAISGTFIIETARFGWAVPISSGGLSVIDARDVALAHVNAIDRGLSGERYILTTANLTYDQWFSMIASACRVRAPMLTTPDMLLEPMARLIEALRRLGINTPMDANQTRLGGTFVCFDGSKAHRDLFTPQIDIETSLHETWQWYSERGYIKHNLLTRLINWI